MRKIYLIQFKKDDQIFVKDGDDLIRIPLYACPNSGIYDDLISTIEMHENEKETETPSIAYLFVGDGQVGTIATDKEVKVYVNETLQGEENG